MKLLTAGLLPALLLAGTGEVRCQNTDAGLRAQLRRLEARITKLEAALKKMHAKKVATNRVKTHGARVAAPKAGATVWVQKGKTDHDVRVIHPKGGDGVHVIRLDGKTGKVLHGKDGAHGVHVIRLDGKKGGHGLRQYDVHVRRGHGVHVEHGKHGVRIEKHRAPGKKVERRVIVRGAPDAKPRVMRLVRPGNKEHVYEIERVLAPKIDKKAAARKKAAASRKAAAKKRAAARKAAAKERAGARKKREAARKKRVEKRKKGRDARIGKIRVRV